MDSKNIVGYGATGLICLLVGAGTAAATMSNAGSDVQPPTPTKTITKTVEVSPAREQGVIAGDGIFEVKRLHPGKYESKTAPDAKCSWKRLSSLTPITVIDSGAHEGTTKVTIKKSDKYFMSSGCVDWKKVK